MRRGPAIIFALAACSFDASGVAENGADASTTGKSDTTSTTSSSTSPTSSTTLATTTTKGESSGETSGVGSSSTTELDTSSSGNAEQGESTSTGEPADCLDLLWVTNAVDPTGTTDQPLRDHLESLGYSITAVMDDQSVASDADGQCAVLISAVSDSGDVNGKFHDVAVPVVTWEFAVFDDMGFAVMTSDYDVDDGATDIVIVDATHPLAAGFAMDEVVTLYQGVGRVNWALADGAAIVGVRTDVATHASLFAYEADDLLADGTVAPAKRVALPFSNAEMGDLQPAALDLLAAAVQWAIAP